MASNKKLNLPVYTYEFMPAGDGQATLFQSEEEIKEADRELMKKKQEILQKYLDMIARGELIPKMDDKEFRCKTLYNQGGVMIFKIENIKDEEYPWDFGIAKHQIGPNCHVIVDNRKDMQHIAIERNRDAFSSPNVVKNILNATLKPLLKAEGLIFDINPQFQPKEFWDYIEAERMYGIKEIRFYFPYPNLPAVSDKYGDYMKQVGIDYKCMPGLILFAPDDLDMELSREDLVLNFWLGAASESGIPIAVKSKRKGARTHLVGRNSSITWGMDRNILEALDPRPNEAESLQTKLEFLEQDDKQRMEEKITEFVNNGRFMKDKPTGTDNM